MKGLIITIAMLLSASIFAQDFNPNPQIGDKGKLKAKIIKVLDENTMLIQSGDRVYKVYASPELKAFQHSCEAEEILIKYSRTGTIKHEDKNIPLLMFSGVVTKEEIEKEQAERVKILNDKKNEEKLAKITAMQKSKPREHSTPDGKK